jgi:hypothetical protein
MVSRLQAAASLAPRQDLEPSARAATRRGAARPRGWSEPSDTLARRTASGYARPDHGVVMRYAQPLSSAQ